jgi:hypothetical protein
MIEGSKEPAVLARAFARGWPSIRPPGVGLCHRRLKALTTEWVEIALALAKEKLRADKERYKSEAATLKQKKGAIRGT